MEKMRINSQQLKLHLRKLTKLGLIEVKNVSGRRVYTTTRKRSLIPEIIRYVKKIPQTAFCQYSAFPENILLRKTTKNSGERNSWQDIFQNDVNFAFSDDCYHDWFVEHVGTETQHAANVYAVGAFVKVVLGKLTQEKTTSSMCPCWHLW